MNLYAEFDQVIRALTAAKVRFAIVGGLAVGMYGFVRATEDIDLLTLPEHLAVIRSGLAKLGYRENSETIHFRNAGMGLRRFYRRMAGQPELFVVDVLLAETPTAAAVVRRARRHKYADLQVPLVTRADLVWMKQQRGSKQDAADIENLQRRDRE